MIGQAVLCMAIGESERGSFDEFSAVKEILVRFDNEFACYDFSYLSCLPMSL